MTAFTEATREAADALVARYPKPRSALLPLLHLVQSEEGWVSPDGVAFCAEVLGLTKAEVGAVATFYTMYKRRPVGDWLVSVCTNLSCQLRGGQEVFDRLRDRLGVGHDETTPDGRFTLEHAECLAACDYAPVVTVNYEFFDCQTPESAVDLVDAIARGAVPVPARGERPVPFREVERQLAGLGHRAPAAPTGAPDTARADHVADHAGDPVSSETYPAPSGKGPN